MMSFANTFAKISERLVTLSSKYFDKGQTNSSACAKPDELVLRMTASARLVEQSFLQLCPSNWHGYCFTLEHYDQHSKSS